MILKPFDDNTFDGIKFEILAEEFDKFENQIGAISRTAIATLPNWHDNFKNQEVENPEIKTFEDNLEKIIEIIYFKKKVGLNNKNVYIDAGDT